MVACVVFCCQHSYLPTTAQTPICIISCGGTVAVAVAAVMATVEGGDGVRRCMSAATSNIAFNDETAAVEEAVEEGAVSSAAADVFEDRVARRRVVGDTGAAAAPELIFTGTTNSPSTLT
jgi:hypothetical protein